MLGELHDWAIKQAEAGDHRTVGVYSGALGFGYNKDLLAKNNLPEPKCWADLIKPEFKGHIQIANPNSSGTAYTMLATIVQLMGEEKGFEYMKALHKNVNQYTKSGSAPIKAAGLGETTVGIVFLHDAVAQVAAGFPIVPVAPCEGTGYEIGSMSIIAGARNEDEAKKFYDWALSADVQSRAQTVNSFQLPSNKDATQSPLAPDLVDDQAHRLRLRQVRLDRGAQAPAEEVGRGGGLAAAVGVTTAPARRLHPTVFLWMVVGLVGFCAAALVRRRRRILELRLASRRLAVRRGRGAGALPRRPGREALAGAARASSCCCRC